MDKPILVCIDEWYFKGCFIQKQEHPMLKPFHVFQDTEEQRTVGTCFTFSEAKTLCKQNEVKEPCIGIKNLL